MASNYDSWKISSTDFSEQRTMFDKLKFLLRFAVLAPSGHNTQPWNFSIKNIDNQTGEISLWVNKERSLEGSDPQRHQLLIAFGCMIENLIIAAGHYGYKTDIKYFPDPQSHNLIAKVLFSEIDKSMPITSANDTDNLVSAIPSRHTNRGQYLDRALPEHFLENIKRYETDDLKISVITRREEKNAIADIVNEAQVEAMDEPAFRDELSHYIKSSFTKEPTGMPGFALEIPAPVSLFASHLIKKTNLSRKNRKKDDALLKQYTPGGFLVISSRGNTHKDWLAAGRLFERIWLAATVDGLNCSPMAAAIQSPKYSASLKRALGSEFEPQVFSRIGYGKKKFRHSPRFKVDALLVTT